MLRHFAIKFPWALIVFAISLGGVARAAALVGATSHFAVEPPSLEKSDRLKADYGRPDTIPFPARNPYTPEKAILGRMLFFDTRLSGSGALSCASCHNPAFGHGDGLAKAVGDGMRPLDRRSPSIANSAWGQVFMWDGRAASLEEQALGPIQSPHEMNQTLDRLIQTLAEIPEYKSLFTAAFPRGQLTQAAVVDAIATYERTVVSAASPFDTWVGGNETAISDSARRGFDLFNTRARCASCHGGWLFTDDGFHDIGLPDDDEGRGLLFPRIEKLRHAFRTPGLRDTARRGPYMHDGSLPTLEAVVAHYNSGGVSRPSRSELVTPLGLSPAEEADIVAFLETLSGPLTSNTIPALPR
jgi:cytochrome c peroxidase